MPHCVMNNNSMNEFPYLGRFHNWGFLPIRTLIIVGNSIPVTPFQDKEEKHFFYFQQDFLKQNHQLKVIF